MKYKKICKLLIRSFLFNDTANTEIYTSFPTRRSSDLPEAQPPPGRGFRRRPHPSPRTWMRGARGRRRLRGDARSEEHTSELQSRQYLVCRLLLEKKKCIRNHSCSSVVQYIN